MSLSLRKATSFFGAFLLLGAVTLIAGAGCGGTTVVPPGTVDWKACTGPGQCELALKGCCAPCGAPAVTDMDGVHREHVDDHRQAVCPEPMPCPKCATGFEPNLAAFCENKACAALDVREHSISNCEGDADCQLRYAGCCEACGGAPEALIALNKTELQTYAQQVCAPDQDCPACAPIYPEGYAAVCNAKKHCEVKLVQGLCPTDAPEGGSPCTAEGLACTYGSDPRPSCRMSATCTAGTWLVLAVKCAGLPGPGEQGCPMTKDVNGDCMSDGLLCDMGGGAICACGMCAGGGPCSVTPHWACAGAPPNPELCPPVLPNLGAHPCTESEAGCIYGVCGTIASAGRVCDQGVWKDQPVACPE
jgi:hypothetical protein